MRSQMLNKILRMPRQLKKSFSSICTLSQDPLMHRRPELGILGDFEIAHFERLLNSSTSAKKAVLTKPDELEFYNNDYTGQIQGNSKMVLRPTTTEEMSDVLKLCNNWHLAVVPQGGNTSLVGTSTPIFDEIIISTRHMDKIHNIDRDSGVVVCDAGVVPSNLETILADPDYNLVPPLDLGSWEICNIGGNVATNARGIKTLKSPDFRSSIVGLEAVLPNGEVLNCLEGSRKDLVGVDLKQCLIGTEGTFGIITKVAMRCPQRPKSTELAFLTCEDYESIIEILRLARFDLAENLTAFEYMNQNSIAVVIRELNIKPPVNISLTNRNRLHAVLIETATSAIDNRGSLQMAAFIEKVRDHGLCQAGVISQNLKQAEQLWEFRKSVVEASKRTGSVFKFDLNVTPTKLPELVRLLEAVTSSGGCEHSSVSISGAHDRVCRRSGSNDDDVAIRDLNIFGQLPNGSIHVVVTIDADQNHPSNEIGLKNTPTCVRRLESVLCNWLGMGNFGRFLSLSKDARGQQIRLVHRFDTGEHGLLGSAARNLQYNLKKSWDPKGIMNPYKTWPYITY